MGENTGAQVLKEVWKPMLLPQELPLQQRKMRAEFPESMLNQYPEDEINSKTVFECAMKEDPIAIEVFRYTGQKLGEALANFVMFSSPEAILLLEELSRQEIFILKPAKLHMERNLLPIFRNKSETGIQ